MVSGALLVCKVESTRWPVSDASTPVLAVSCVTHFAHHDDVRVGTQEGAHGRGEIEADLGLHLHLAQPRLGDFHRILGRPDLHVGGVDAAECRVQSRGLAGSGGPHAQDQAVGLGQKLPHLVEVALTHAHFVEREGLGGGQDAHDHVFVPVDRGQSGDTQLDGPVAHAELDLSVLGLAPFGNVQLGHDLEARHQRIAKGGRNLLIASRNRRRCGSGCGCCPPCHRARCGYRRRPAGRRR